MGVLLNENLQSPCMRSAGVTYLQLEVGDGVMTAAYISDKLCPDVCLYQYNIGKDSPQITSVDEQGI